MSNNKTQLSNRVKKRIRHILGQSIFEHELVKGCPETMSKIGQCVNVKQVVKVLELRYNQINTKPISLPGDRDLYTRFKDENRTD